MSKDPLIVDSAIELMNRHAKWKLGVADLCEKWLNDKELSESKKLTLIAMLKAKVGNDSIQQLIAKHLLAGGSSITNRRMLLDIFAHANLGRAFPKFWHEAVRKCLTDKDESLVSDTVEASRR